MPKCFHDIHGKKIFEIGDKFYFEDLGIRNQIIGGNRKFDIEKVIMCRLLICWLRKRQ